MAAEPELSVILKDNGADNVGAGAEITYTLVISNTGDEPATDLVVSQMASAGLTYLDESSTLTKILSAPQEPLALIYDGDPASPAIRTFDTTGQVISGTMIQNLALDVIGKGLNGSLRTDVSLNLETPDGASQSWDYKDDLNQLELSGRYQVSMETSLLTGSAEGVYSVTFTEKTDDGGPTVDDHRVDTLALKVTYPLTGATATSLLDGSEGLQLDPGDSMEIGMEFQADSPLEALQFLNEVNVSANKADSIQVSSATDACEVKIQSADASWNLSQLSTGKLLYDLTVAIDYQSPPGEAIEVIARGVSNTLVTDATGSGQVVLSGLDVDEDPPFVVLASLTNAQACDDSLRYDPPAADACSGNDVGGLVFRDFNANGSMDASELGAPFVGVRAFDQLSSLVGWAVSDREGRFTLRTTDQTALLDITNFADGLRLEFDVDLDPPIKAGVSGGTRTQFVKAGVPNCELRLAVSDPAEYCNANPTIAVACYMNGSGIGNQEDGVVYFSHDAFDSGNGSGIPEKFRSGTGVENPVLAATIEDVGSVWGTAFQKQPSRLFLSSFLKRHVGFSKGPGHVHILDFSSGTPVYDSSFDLQGVSPANGGPFIDLGSVERTNVEGDIAAGELGDTQLPQAPAGRSRDLDAFAKVGKMSFGDIDLTEDESGLWLVNLNQRALIEVDVSKSGAPGDVNQYLLEDMIGLPQCKNGSLRPWALKFHRGRGYLGVVCDGSESQDPVDMQAYVFSFDPKDPTLLVTEIAFPLAYQRENQHRNFVDDSWLFRQTEWKGWIDRWEQTGYNTNGYSFEIAYTQPILSDIEFASDDDMIIGFMDRWGNQTGVDNYIPLSGSEAMISGSSAGDLFHACLVDGRYVVEGAPGCEVDDPGYEGPLNLTTGNATDILDHNTLATQISLDGIYGNGEFYYQDVWVSQQTVTDVAGHSEIASGALAVVPGTDAVLSTVFDPITLRQRNTPPYSQTQGIRRFDTNNGTSIDGYLIVPNLDDETFGKSNGLGDIELLCDNAPVEIGNYVFFDTDHDGLQDASDYGFEGVLVTLYTAAGERVATVETDRNGHYLFSSDSERDSIDVGDMNDDGINYPESLFGLSILEPGTDLDKEFVIVVGTDGLGNDQFNGQSLALNNRRYTPTSANAINVGAGSEYDTVDSDGIVGDLAALGLSQVFHADVVIEANTFGRNDHRYDFGFGKPGTWTAFVNAYQDILGSNDPTSVDLALENPDGDIDNNFLEYALCLHPGSGVSRHFTFCSELNIAGGLDIAFIRAKSGLPDVTYVVQGLKNQQPEDLSDYDNESEWIDLLTFGPSILMPEVPAPVSLKVTDRGDGSEEIRLENADRLPGLVREYGVVRLATKLTSPSVTSATKAWGWQETVVETQCETVGNPFLRKETFSGQIDSVDGLAIEVGNSLRADITADSVIAGFENEKEYYLEIVSDPASHAGESLVGHRFDITEAMSDADTIVLDSQSSQNTLRLVGSLPDGITLDGAKIVIRPHFQVIDLFPPSSDHFSASNNVDVADRLLFWDSAQGRYDVLYFAAVPSAPRWVATGSTTLEDQGSRVIGPGEGHFLHHRHADPLTLLTVGLIRDTPFRGRLVPGYNFFSYPWPTNRSPEEIGLTPENGFSGARNFTQADQIQSWIGDNPTNIQAFLSHFMIDLTGLDLTPAPIKLRYWTNLLDSNISDIEDELEISKRQIIKRNRSQFILLSPDPSGAPREPLEWTIQPPWQP